LKHLFFQVALTVLPKIETPTAEKGFTWFTSFSEKICENAVTSLWPDASSQASDANRDRPFQIDTAIASQR